MNTVSVQEAEYAAHRLAKEWMSWNEPIPDFGTRFPNILESCLAAPFQEFAGQSPYKGLLGKAGILFYLMIKNHPFQNGNKRIAVTTILIFLFKNKKWLSVDNTSLYNFAKWVAASSPDVKTSTVLAVEQFLGKYIVNLE
ncbi:MAG: death on curing protein [Parcubacteria group bacterium Gr01-1014_3]|nr:MAG: death on curing protein [Parcubacteria group bacterium Gr01-1014_3]